MEEHITGHRHGFPSGYTTITEAVEPRCDTGIEFGILKMLEGETFCETSNFETAYLLMTGSVEIQAGKTACAHTRNSFFDEPPFCVHTAPGTTVRVKALSDVEMAVSRTANTEHFPVEVYDPETVPNEHRGDGQVDQACLRWVRTIFDDSRADPRSLLVLGEVVNMPGRWSSYPPHHHPQPEIYHYRFTDSRGYGHAELGDDVLKVRQFDTLKILDEKDHAQCSAPGYGMYYIWVIRHLPQHRYTVPEFTEEHKWTMAKDAKFWRPQLTGVK